MKSIILYSAITILFSACLFGDNESVYHKDLPGGLYLDAMFNREEIAVWERDSIMAVINPSIIQIGWSDDFVIAESHPFPHNMPSQTTGSRILSGELEDSADISHFDRSELVNFNGKWRLRYPYAEVKTDSTIEYKVLPRWSIIDIKHDLRVFSTYSYEDFEAKRRELNVPDSLTFFLKFKEFE